MTIPWTQALALMAVQHLWQAGLLLLCVALLLGRCNLRAETRSWVLCGAFVLAAASPLLVLLPASPLPHRADTVNTVNAVTHAEAARPALPAAATAPAAKTITPTRAAALTLLLQALAALWLLGALLQLLRLLHSWWQARRLYAGACPDPELEAALRWQLPTGASVAVSASAEGPMVVGLHRPRILVPASLLQTLPRDALHDLLRHEVAHLHRRDLWASTAQRIVLALYWWSPLQRQLGKRLDLAREMACDERAALHARSGKTYASSLLAGAAGLIQRRDSTPALAVGMSGHGSGLRQRIDGLLALDSSTPAAARVGWIGLCLLALSAHVGITMAATPRVGKGETLSTAAVAAARAVPAAQVEQLIDAAAAGNLADVQRLLQSGIPVDASQRGDGTALIAASKHGQLAVMEALLAQGAQPDLPSLGDGNPLIAAASRGQRAAVERLISAGADVDRIVPGDETPLINAARSGDVSTVAALVEHGADVNLGVRADRGQWRSPLNQARNADIRGYLLQHGAVAQQGRRSTP